MSLLLLGAGLIPAQQPNSNYHVRSTSSQPTQTIAQNSQTTPAVVSSSLPTETRWVAPTSNSPMPRSVIAPAAVPAGLPVAATSSDVVRAVYQEKTTTPPTGMNIPTTSVGSGVPQTPLATSKNGTIQPVRYQLGGGVDPEDRSLKYEVQLDPPGLERLSQLDSDSKLQERIRQETRTREEDAIPFPEGPILSRSAYNGRGGMWPRQSMTIEPNYVCYRQLYFQDLNAERYGWDLGIVHPLVCTGKFLYDFTLFPMHAAQKMCTHDANTGYCLPGDPVPFMLYPPELSYKGTLTEIAVIVALVAVFP